MTYLSQNTRMQIARSAWSRKVDFLITEAKDGNAMYAIGTMVTFKVLEPEDAGMKIEPTFALSESAVQELMDDLWAAGFRPSKGSDNRGHLEAVQNHLSDMQRIVFGTLQLPMEE